MRDLKIELNSGCLRAIESSGKGPALVLCHGNSSGAEMFRPLLESELGRRFRMLALDLPGHGDSYRSSNHEQEYSLPMLAQTLVAAVRVLELRDYVLVGHSLGGHLMSSALSQLRGARGLVLVSAPPLKAGSLLETFKPDPTGGALFKAALTPAELESFAKALLEPGNVSAPVASALERRIRETDPHFRSGLGSSIGAGMIEDEVLSLERTEVRTLLVTGSEDRFIRQECYEHVKLKTPWREGLVSFRGSGHSPHLDSPERFAVLLGGFLAEGPR